MLYFRETEDRVWHLVAGPVKPGQSLICACGKRYSALFVSDVGVLRSEPDWPTARVCRKCKAAAGDKRCLST